MYIKMLALKQPLFLAPNGYFAAVMEKSRLVSFHLVSKAKPKEIYG